jgi:RNA polymerase sigma-70 factor, ECF subfamily
VATSTELSAISTSDAGFDALFIANYKPLTRVIYRVLGDTAAAEEVAAEAFWKLHRNPPASDHNLAGWLYRTGIRLAFDSLKKRKRRVNYEAHAPGPTPMPSPEDAVRRGEERFRVRQVLSALSPVQSSLLILRGEGYSISEIAEILALNPNSVGTLLARADSAFRKEYVNRYGEQ